MDDNDNEKEGNGNKKNIWCINMALLLLLPAHLTWTFRRTVDKNSMPGIEKSHLSENSSIKPYKSNIFL